VTFAREKRLLLGVAAALVALPLPFNDALDWPALLLFLAAVGAFLHRAWKGSGRWLSARTLNLLGLAYLPVLVVDLAASGRVQFVRPVLHLTLFGLAAKLWSLGHEKDKWQAWIGLFFLFLAAMSTSTHPAVVAYLVAFTATAVVLMARFVHLHVLSSFGAVTEGERPPLPLGGIVVAMVLATVLLAVPLFMLLPRVRTPYVLGPGGLGADPTIPRAGFSDEMSLDLIGRIRDNPAIAARIVLEGVYGNPQSLRLKAAAYDVWEGRSWKQTRGGQERRRDPASGSVRLARLPVEGRARIALEPLRSRSLVVPAETVAVVIEGQSVKLDDGGALLLAGMPSSTFEYEARLGRRPISLAAPPALDGEGDATLDDRGLSVRVRELAAEWAGTGPAGERAARIERRLLEDYGYTTAFIGRGGTSPIEHFLFEARRGHCEYFASAMVLLLRAEGIPARLVTGFYGAEWSPWENVWIVRQSNAHAWVEAWVPEFGWRIFDPTPPSGRPLAAPRSFRLYARQAWEALVHRWDRWVISYDFEDQLSVVGEMRLLWKRFLRDIFDRGRNALPALAESATESTSRTTVAAAEGRWTRGWGAAAAIAALAAAIGFVVHLHQRPEWTARSGYERLRAALVEAGAPVADSLAPLALARLAARRLPEVSAPAERLVEGYLREVFAGEPPDAAALARLRADLVAVDSAARRARRMRRRRS
jgi:protein-glutamine gamma-glutamyltransferase